MKLERVGAGPRMSEAVIAGGLAHLSGQIAEATDGRPVAEQTREVLGFIDEFLAAAGTDRTKLLRATIWLSDIATFAEMNAVWDAWVAPGCAPARATVEAKLAAPGHAVEIMVVAARDDAHAHTKGVQDMSIKRIGAGPRMSRAVVANGMVYLAGQVANNAAGKSVGEQTKDILSLIDSVLAQAGTDKSKLVSANIWLSDISTFAEMNAVWDAWVSPGNTPARATVEAKLADPKYAVEIMVTALA